MIGRDLLPNEKEAHEISRRNRLDLFSQTIERVAVNPRQQTARTPLWQRSHRGVPGAAAALGCGPCLWCSGA